MTTLLAIAALLLSPPELTVEDRCDVIEVNHYYDEHGEPIFTQAIFHDHPQHNVVAWRLWKRTDITPVYDYHSREWSLTWHDGTTLRTVRAKCYRETFSQHDPELFARSVYPKDKRRELLRPTTPHTKSGVGVDDLDWND